MPLLLAEPYNPGSAEPGKLYTCVKISEMIHYTESRAIRITLSRGYLDENGTYVVGRYFPPVPPITIRDYMDITVNDVTGETISVLKPHYSMLVSKKVESINNGDYVYNLVSNALYTYLIENIPEFYGTII